jgi:hypothetical protein
MKHYLIFLFVFLYGPSCGFADIVTPSSISELFGSEARKKILVDPDSVSLSLLRLPSGGDRTTSIFDYKEVNPKVINGEIKEKLLSILLDSNAYSWPKRVMPDGTVHLLSTECSPIYVARAKITKANGSFELNFCFRCQHVLLTEKGAIISFAFLGNRKKELIHMFRIVFPDEDNFAESTGND